MKNQIFIEKLINNKLTKYPIFTLEYFNNKKEGNLILLST